MKKKLFVWAYTHFTAPIVQTCALDEDDHMIVSVMSGNHQQVAETLATEMAEMYDVKIQDQEKLEEHMYRGASRDYGVPKDFQIAWDKFRAGGIEKLN